MLRDVAAKRLDQLDALPDDIGERIGGLREYDFLEPDARQRFDELVERLQQQMLDQYVSGMSDAIRSMRPEDLAANREMVRDLNDLIRQRIGGADPDVSEFLAKHGAFFPGARTLRRHHRAARRADGRDAVAAPLDAPGAAGRAPVDDGGAPAGRPAARGPRRAGLQPRPAPAGRARASALPFSGDEPLGLAGALARIDQLAAMDRLGDALSDVEGPDDLAGLDRDEVRDLLGDDAVRDLDALDALARRLEAAGYLTRDGERLELTPRGSRRIGQKVLDDLFARLRRDAFGGHRTDRSGRGGEREETTKPYEFGDPFHLDLRATLTNALAREENAPATRRGRDGARRGPFACGRRTSRSTAPRS